MSGWDLGRPSVGRRAALLDPWDDPLVTHVGGIPVDLSVLPNTPMSLEPIGPVFASWSKRVLASVLDSAIGAGATFLAFGDQSVTGPFIGAQLGSVVPPGVQSVPAASFNESGWVVAGRPGRWRLAGSLTSTFLQRVPRLTANGLQLAPDPNVPGGGKSLLLDPVTLKYDATTDSAVSPVSGGVGR